MIDVGLLMNLGMILVTGSAIPSMVAVLRNRNNLKGFSILALLGNIVANLSFGIAQSKLRIWISAALNAVMVIYSLVVLFYVWRCRHNKEEDDPFDCSKPKGARVPNCENGPSPLCKHCSKDTECGEIIRRNKNVAKSA